MSLKEMQLIKLELEEINNTYRQTFALSARLDLVERVGKLLALLGSEVPADNPKDASFPI